MHERNRQNKLIAILAACLVVSVGAVALWPHNASNSPSNNTANATAAALLPPRASVQQPQQPVQMPQALQGYSQPVVTQNSGYAPSVQQAPQYQNQAPQNPITQNQLGQIPAIQPPVMRAPPVQNPVVALGARYDQQAQRYLAPPAQQATPQRATIVQMSAFQTYVVGKLSARGENMPADWQPLFDREARGDKKGKLLIAAKFLKGEGVSRDQGLAVEMIRQAADAGEKEAMMWLAYANQGGNIGKTDVNAAIRWFQAAGKAGVPQAYTELGRIYETGADGAPDLETAVAWYQRGAQTGDAKAAEALNRLTQRQPAQQQPYAPQTPAQQLQQILQPGAQNTVPTDAPVTNTASNDLFVPVPSQGLPPEPLAPLSAQQAAANNIPNDIPAPAYSVNVPSVAATSVVASFPTPAPSSQVGMSKEQASADNKAIQRMLRVLGYKVDRVDGEYGPQTASAIRAYQRDHSVYPDGEPSSDLMDSLMRDVRGQ